MKKKILTLEDLVKFCKTQQMKTFSFSSKDNDGEPLCVAIPATFEKKEDEESKLLFADIKAFHTGRNLNGSGVTVNAAKKSLPTFAYKPILAAFTTDKNGDEDFMGHEMDMDDEGNIIYIEQQVGSFTADEPWMEEDPEDKDKQWVFARAAIPREYTSAASIIERKGGTRVSVELYIYEFSYNEDEDLLQLEDIEVSGLTLLGIYEEGDDPETDYVREGMKGARLDIADFSKKNNCSFSYEELKDVIKETVIQTLNDMQNSKEGGKNMKFSEEKLNELLEKYAVKSEDITFDLEAIESDEALEEAFEAQFSNPSTEPETSEPETESQPEDNYSLSVTFNGETKQFAKSLNDLINDITTLVNATYGEEDNAWYACDVFDDKTVLFHDWWNNKHFKQKYGNKDGNLVLKGERAEVFVRYLTEDELSALEDLKSNFEAKVKECDEAKELIAKYEAEPEKLELLNSKDYEQVAETAEFVELKKKETYFDLSIEDVREKADSILLNAAKAGKVEFAAVQPEEQKPVETSKPLTSCKKQKRFGSLFDGI